MPVQFPRLLADRRRLETEVKDLRRQAAAVNTPATFSQSAKLERKAIARERELKALQQQTVGSIVARDKG